MAFTNHSKRKWLRMGALLLCAAIAFNLAKPASAGPLTSSSINVYDDGALVGGGLFYISGGGPGAYSLNVYGSTPNFSFVAILGASNQPGNSLQAILETAEFAVTANSGGHTLKFAFSDNAFSNPPGGQMLVTSSGSATFSGLTTTSDHASLQSYGDSANALFGTTSTSGLQTASSNGVSPNSVALQPNVASTLFARIGDFSLTSVVEVYLQDAGAKVSVTSSTVATTPEPASMAMFGIGLAGMAGYGWRRRSEASEKK